MNRNELLQAIDREYLAIAQVQEELDSVTKHCNELQQRIRNAEHELRQHEGLEYDLQQRVDAMQESVWDLEELLRKEDNDA